MIASGIVAQDNFLIGSLSLLNQTFLNAVEVKQKSTFREDQCAVRSVLGLTPETLGSTLGFPSPFQNIVKQGLLESNLFSLRLKAPAELTFGSLTRPEEEYHWLPLANETNEWYLTGRWQTETTQILIATFEFSLENLIASFHTSTSFIHLPNSIVNPLLVNLGFRIYEWMMPPYIMCDQREFMPDIHFELSGVLLTLSPYDYTIEWPLQDGQNVPFCISALTNFGAEHDTDKEIILGSAFLRAFHSVFDLENRRIGCKCSITLVPIDF
jgi:saccharopepsin